MGLLQLAIRYILCPSSFRGLRAWEGLRTAEEALGAHSSYLHPAFVTLNLPIYLYLRNSVTKFSIPYFHFMSTFVAVSVQTISIFYHFWGSVIRGYLTLISWAARGSRIMARSTGRESLESSLLQHPGSLPRSSSSARRSGSSYHGTEPWPRMAASSFWHHETADKVHPSCSLLFSFVYEVTRLACVPASHPESEPGGFTSFSFALDTSE